MGIVIFTASTKLGPSARLHKNSIYYIENKAPRLFLGKRLQ